MCSCHFLGESDPFNAIVVVEFVKCIVKIKFAGYRLLVIVVQNS